MSALGHKQTSRDVCVTSALPPIADIRRLNWQVRSVPIADMGGIIETRQDQLCHWGIQDLLRETP